MLRHSLTGKQKSFLRSMGMGMDPVVQMGKDGLTPAVVQSASEAIKKRELIKVRVLQNSADDAEQIRSMIETLTERVDAELVQIIGRNGLLFKRNFDKPKIELP
ncbi:MAG: YhbY family RNA-binding protein [Selenomonadaceae bacterium]|nr:YhbY family RNA-binding protein [Selenomonadaceae bacterium]MDY2684671.1 YhbY family RNA-binding protein [Selenomonadaceae bacterium]